MFWLLPWFDDPMAVEEKNPGSVPPPEPLGMYHVLGEHELYKFLHHLPEMDTYYEMHHSLLSLPHSDDNLLSPA